MLLGPRPAHTFWRKKYAKTFFRGNHMVSPPPILRAREEVRRKRAGYGEDGFGSDFGVQAGKKRKRKEIIRATPITEKCTRL